MYQTSIAAESWIPQLRSTIKRRWRGGMPLNSSREGGELMDGDNEIPPQSDKPMLEFTTFQKSVSNGVCVPVCNVAKTHIMGSEASRSLQKLRDVPRIFVKITG